MEEKRNRFLILATAVAALGGLLFGFDTGVISGVIPSMKSYFVLNDFMEGATVSALIAGCIVGVLFSGKPGDLLGRKLILIISSLLFLVSAIGSALATHLWILIAFRFVGGVAVGTASVFSPMYISEISPPARRGTLVSVNQLAIVVGIFLSFYSNYYLEGIGENSWRWMLGVMGLPAVLFFIALLFVPESPRWLAQKGNTDEAFDILKKINGRKQAMKEIEEIKTSMKTRIKVTYKEVFSKKVRPMLIVGVFIAAFSQITGINAIMYYAPTIFKDMGLNNESALLQQAIIGTVNLVFTFVAIIWVDRFGRKPLLLIGCIGMLISLTVITIAYYMRQFEGFIILFFILTYIASFAASIGPVSWVIISEIFPNKIRSKAMSLAILSLWIANLIVTQFFPVIRDRLGGATAFLFFTIACVFLLVFIIKKVPETKGKSLEELEHELLKV
jgi:MFS transporter, SP family, arabinose:H+ symporter